MRLLVLAAWALLSPAAGAYTDRLIQIGILHGVRQLKIRPEGRFILRDETAGESLALQPLKSYTAVCDGATVAVGPHRVLGPARLIPMEEDATMAVGARRYRGHLILRPDGDGGMTVVDELGVESYLLGVLPHEMEPNWPLEALKAQAVLARTFAYYNLGKYKKSGFDLTADTRSQVFGGVAAESETVRRAVRETRGEVLGYGGQLLAAYYHACCAGHTADYGLVWGGGSRAPKPLRGVKDRYCGRSPLRRWRAFIARDDALAALQGHRLIAGKLKSFRLGRRDPAGYVRSFQARIGGESLAISAESFRRAVGPSELRSLRISSVKLRRNGLEFFGRGSGHGVGLCQWGARLQAEKGRSYEKILDYYFPGATLSVVDE
jgi:stage II sporulation protein D